MQLHTTDMLVLGHLPAGSCGPCLCMCCQPLVCAVAAAAPLCLQVPNPLAGNASAAGAYQFRHGSAMQVTRLWIVCLHIVCPDMACCNVDAVQEYVLLNASSSCKTHTAQGNVGSCADAASTRPTLLCTLCSGPLSSCVQAMEVLRMTS